MFREYLKVRLTRHIKGRANFTSGLAFRLKRRHVKGRANFTSGLAFRLTRRNVWGRANFSRLAFRLTRRHVEDVKGLGVQIARVAWAKVEFRV